MSLFRNRNFLILFSGQMVSTVGDNLYGIAILWYVLAITHSNTDLAITGFGMTIPPILGLFVGVWVDRWRKKSVMIVSDVVRAVLLLSLFFLSSESHVSFWAVLVLIVLVEAVGTFFDPASSSLIPLIVHRDQLTSASGMTQSMGAMAALGGTLGGGALIGLIGAPLLFLSDAISFVASVLSLPFVKTNELKKAAVEQSSLVAEWREGFKVIAKSRYMLQSGITSAVTNFSLAGTGVLITAWVREDLHGSAFVLSEMTMGLLVGSIIGGLTCSWLMKNVSYRWIVSFTLIGIGVGTSAIALWANTYWDIGALVFGGLNLGWCDGCGGSVRMQVVPGDVRGRVFSTMRTFGRMAMPLGSAVLGTLMVLVPLWIAVILTGVGPILSGISYLMPYSRAVFSEIEQRKLDSATSGVAYHFATS